MTQAACSVQGSRQGTGLRVLVVDDYPEAAETACMLLSMLGHECRFATTGKDALIEAARFVPDVAILDIGLPDVSGFALARELRKQFAGRSLYLAAVTGWGQPEDCNKAFEAGFDHHVLKPADQRKLMNILELAQRERGRVTSSDPGRA
jgi:DNA-binding response OmpR family regulator